MPLLINGNIKSQLAQGSIGVFQIFSNIQTELIGLFADLASSFFRREPHLKLGVHRHGVSAAMNIGSDAALDTHTSCSACHLPLA
ncbi:hypothetical protein D3C85_1592140 [compost metagenome]